MEQFPKVTELTLEQAAQWQKTIQLYESYQGRMWDKRQWTHVKGNQSFYDLSNRTSHEASILYEADDLLNAAPLNLMPSCSIIVPCSLKGEDVSNIIDTINSIYRSCLSGLITAEVILWMDHEVPVKTLGEGPGLDRYGQPDYDFLDVSHDSYFDAHEGYTDKIDTLLRRSSIASFSNEFIRVRSVLSLRPPGEGMNEVRHKSMLEVARDALQRSIPDTHIVGWIDADTRGLSRYALRDLCYALEESEAHVVHAEHIFGQNTTDELLLPLHTLRGTRKAATAYGIAKRMLERNIPLNARHPYDEESGFFTMLRTWLRSGGNDTRDPETGEARSALDRMALAMANGDIEPDIDLIKYVPGARIIASDRWVRTLIELLPNLTELPRSLFGPDYKLYSNIMDGSTPRRQARITRDEVWATMLETESFQKEHNPEGVGYTETQKEQLKILLARLAFDLAA
jgi:hypothetical protein